MMNAAAPSAGGQMMAPYVVEATYDRSGRILEQRQPSVWKTPVSPATAATLTSVFLRYLLEGWVTPSRPRRSKGCLPWSG